MTAQPEVLRVTLIRHAPTQAPEGAGRLCGRLDWPAALPEGGRIAALAARLGVPGRLAVSAARRCRETAAALWPGHPATVERRLWEQDFGAWEGLRSADLPDLGALSGVALAAHRPPGGESFADLCARVTPVLEALCAAPPVAGGLVIVAHAGTIRAALAAAIGSVPGALAFRIDPLSETTLLRSAQGWAIEGVNR